MSSYALALGFTIEHIPIRSLQIGLLDMRKTKWVLAKAGPVRHIDPKTGNVIKLTEAWPVEPKSEPKAPTPCKRKSKKKIDKYRAFYKSQEWKQARYSALAEFGNRCQCCGASPDDGRTKIVVDHIKSLRFHWELRLERSNLQILCDDCNWGKGARDATNWRDSNVVTWGDEWPD